MNNLMGTLKFAGRTFLQILKAAVSFVTSVVTTLFLLFAWTYLQQELGFRWMEYAWNYVGAAFFVFCFYEIFNLFETEMTARKKLLVTSLGIVLVALFFSVGYVSKPAGEPAADVDKFLQKPSPPSSPKPYEEAIYDVYSSLLIGEITQRSLLDKLTNPIPEGVLIRIDTTIDTGSGHGAGFEPNPASLPGNIASQERFDKAVSSAAADYTRRNKESLQLQRKFNLPDYDLITKTEEEAVLKDEGHDQEGSGCREFARKHPDYYRWVELSAVGFNEDQTVAYVYLVEWRGSRQLCHLGIFGHGGPRILHKRNGKWYLVDTGVFADWVT
jgi:hypothetical protein